MLNGTPAFLIYAAVGLGLAAAVDMAPRAVSAPLPPRLAATDAPAAGAAEIDQLAAVRLQRRGELEAALAAAPAPVPWMREAPAPFASPRPDDVLTASAEMPLPQVAEGQPRPGGARARAKIEEDGYRSVRLIERDESGRWRAVALRGQTEVALVVDESGNVSTQ